MIPDTNPTARGRKQPKRGRKPLFDPAVFKERFRRIDRVFAWEDKFRRLLLRFDRLIRIFGRSEDGPGSGRGLPTAGSALEEIARRDQAGLCG